MVKLRFTKSVADSNLYYKVVEGESLILVLYVDDLFLTGAESDRVVQDAASFRVRDERPWIDALLLGS